MNDETEGLKGLEERVLYLERLILGRFGDTAHLARCLDPESAPTMLVVEHPLPIPDATRMALFSPDDK